MNFVEMILPASSDNSLAEIYILFVKNSILLSILVIREDVIDKVLLLMSISMPSPSNTLTRNPDWFCYVWYKVWIY